MPDNHGPLNLSGAPGIAALLDKKNVIAFVGASNNPEKYGYKILKTMLERGFKCIPINLKENEILGQKAYPDLTTAVEALSPTKIDLVDFIVPPPVVLQVLSEVEKLGIKNVWLQPGSESPEAIVYCEQNGINCVHDACVMIESAAH